MTRSYFSRHHGDVVVFEPTVWREFLPLEAGSKVVLLVVALLSADGVLTA